MDKRKIPLFWSTVASIVIVYLFLKVGVPYLSMVIVGGEYPLPVPGALMVMFMALTLVGTFVYISASDENLAEFVRPIVAFLMGGGTGVQRTSRAVLLGALPLLVGWLVFSSAAPEVKTPTALRIQHPTIPSVYEKLDNPFRSADPEVLAGYVEEGRVLYQINCRPCHGTKVDGAGPMARGFRLKPADFTDPGTIATLVEAYLFWRIKEGAPGLPPEASPWDSAMPAWKDELTDEEIWKIILAEYEIAGMEPRKPEKHE